MSAYKPYFIELLKACEQHFDGRLNVFEPNEITEILNYFVWRQNDCLRNCTSSYARHLCEKQAIYGKKFPEMVKMINATNMKHEDIPIEYRYGVFVKKELYEKECKNQKTGEMIKAKRGRIKIKPIIIKADEDFEYLIKDKYWNNN